MASGMSSRNQRQRTTASGLNDFVRRQIEALAGIVLMLIVMAAIAALATWSVADPSFSHATGNVTVNALGAPGAIFADLAMQFFGLSTIPALIPALSLGFFMARGRPVSHRSRRIFAWLAGALLAAAFFACFNPTAAWPLPVGIGGVLGDLMLKLPGMVSSTGYPQGFFALLTGLALLPIASWLLFYAAGFIRNQQVEPRIQDDNEDLFDDGDEEGGLLALGALTHYWLTFKGAVARQLESRRHALDQFSAPKKSVRIPRSAQMDGPDEPMHDDVYDDMPPAPRMRQEPEFAYAPRRDLPSNTLSAIRQTAIGQTDDFDDTDQFEDEDVPFDTAPATARAVAGNRVVEAPVMRADSARQASSQPRMTSRQAAAKPHGFELPSLSFLAEPKSSGRDPTLSKDALEQKARMLESVLDDFGVKGEIVHVRPGPVVTLYELEPAPGIKSSRVIGLADDIARSMSAIACRVAVVPGRNAIGIELPNEKRETVFLREMLASHEFTESKHKLALTLGKTINGEPVTVDIAKMPHVLVAGTTGSGKSVMINTIIMSLVYRMTPQQCRMIMVDPKMVELSVYDGIPHLLTPVVTDPKKAVVALKWAVREMEDRYRKMAKLGVRNQESFNARVVEAKARGEVLSRTVQTGFDRHSGEAIYETEELTLEPMPFIVVVIDEVADLMMVAGKDIEGAVQRLGQMARAAGIHVIMATQRPSVDVITGTIKANFPTRMSFMVTSKIDSRTIIGENGAEQLLGQGDMLYMGNGGRIQRVHGPFVSDSEVEKIVGHLKLQGAPEYLDAITQEEDEDGDDGDGPAGTSALSDSDDPYDQAVAIVLRDKKASTSYIQRRMGIGYNRAASLIERMENEGIVGPSNATGKREILVPTEDD